MKRERESKPLLFPHFDPDHFCTVLRSGQGERGRERGRHIEKREALTEKTLL